MTRLELLGGLLKRVGRFGVKSFTERLTFQKSTYLLQAFGINLGYSFNWYLYGPYSSTLAKDGFELADNPMLLKETSFADSRLEDRFKNCVRFLKPIVSKPIDLEVVASIHYLHQLYGNESKEKILDMVAKKQPYINRKMCQEGYKRLQEAGLF